MIHETIGKLCSANIRLNRQFRPRLIRVLGLLQMERRSDKSCGFFRNPLQALDLTDQSRQE